MIFTVIVLILLGAIAYFHYVQGFFSATISAILSILAAVVAFSYQEVVVQSLLAGKVADEANALVIIALFVGVYGILRVIFDTSVPGNIRLPVTLDKVGAGLMGLVAASFAMGVFVIAAESLPFGPSIAGYSRYALAGTRDVTLPTQRQAIDAHVYDELKSETGTLDPADHNSLLLPVDDWVVNLTSHLSADGSLAGSVNLSKVHPSYVDELFGQRLGVQTGAKHVAYNVKGESQVSVKGIFTADMLPQADDEIHAIRDAKLESTVKSDPAKILLIVRVEITHNASDTDNFIRISPASVRLVANSINYNPIGTLDSQPPVTLRANRVDDYLILPSDGDADFVFLIPRDDLGIVSDPKDKNGPLQLGPDVFIEAKRMGYVDLSGQQIVRGLPAATEDNKGILRKKELPAPKATLPGNAGGGGSTPVASNAPFEFSSIKVSPEMFTSINVGPHTGDSGDLTFTSGTATLHDGKFSKLQITPDQSITLLKTGDNLINQFYEPGGQKIVIVAGSTPSKTSDPWEWAAKLGQFELIDSNNGSYKPHGVARLKVVPADRMVAHFDSDNAVTDVPHGEGRPGNVWIVFVVPQNTTLRELRFDGKRVSAVNQQVQ